MGHSKKIQLMKVTLAAMTSVKVEETIKALKYSMKGIDFAEVLLISDKKPVFLPKGITFKYIDRLTDIDCFNYNMLFEFHTYINTEFALLVHYDGFVVNPSSWRNDFLLYDYIGSPWPIPEDDKSYRDIHGNLCRVGNSVSLRSKRLMELPSQLNLPFDSSCEKNEDTYICCNYRHKFEENGMKIAPLEMAKYFGHETMIPELKGIMPFVFHKYGGSNAQYPEFKISIKARVQRKIHNELSNSFLSRFFHSRSSKKN